MATPTTLPASFTAGQVLTAAQMNDLRGAFRVLQVVSTTKTDTFTMASATYADVTGLSVSITPTSASNKILVLTTITGAQDVGVDANSIQLVRDSTTIGVGDAAGSRVQASASFSAVTENVVDTASINFLDSPATTSATTYKIQVRANQGANNVYVNRTKNDTNGAITSRTISTITVMEISA
jgi:hypothetical protein